MTSRPKLLFALCASLSLALTGCLTQRTVKDGGTTTSQGMVIKRPLKELINTSR